MGDERQGIIGGRYSLEAVIGKGGGGEVWRAHDAQLHRHVAIKLLRVWDEEHKARVWREARLAALLGAKGAVPIYDFGDDGRHCFLVMELVEDPTLETILGQGQPLPMPRALGIACQLMEVLAGAHALSIVHRDVKPQNIFVSGDIGDPPKLRLVDFGLAFLSDSDEQGLGRLTQEAALSGTPAYLSPEQARRDEIGPASDVYSAGCVIYEVCCGAPPFTGGIGELISKQLYVPPIPLTERLPSAPVALSDMLDKMLAKEAADRPTAHEASETLAALVLAMSAGTNRSARALRDVARSDRMVSTTQHEAEHNDEGLAVWLQPPAPDWLRATVASAGFRVVDESDSARVAIVPVDAGLGHMNPKIPVLGWSATLEGVDIATLIRLGFHTLITKATRAEDLTRFAHSLVPRNTDTHKSVT